MRCGKNRHATALVLALVSLFVALGGAPRSDAAGALTAPDRPLAVQLIRSTFSAINDATLTSNYSVLYGLSAPEFRTAYSTDQLASALRVLRDRRLDLAVISQLEPVIEHAVFHTDQGVVQFRGYFPAPVVQLRFLLSYQFVDDRWKLFGFDIGLEPPPAHDLASGNSL